MTNPKITRLAINQPRVDPLLLMRPHPLRTEGPRGYLLRLAEANWTTCRELQHLGVFFEPRVLQSQCLLPDVSINPDLHKTIILVAECLQQFPRVWNHQFSRFCPQCLAEDAFWRIGWELLFHDACSQHGVWLIDLCGSCGENVSWDRDHLVRCQCGSDLRTEQASDCPDSVARLSSILLEKLEPLTTGLLPLPFEKLDIAQTQQLIRYMGSYVQPEAGRNPLKIQQAGSMVASWSITSLAAEILLNWPNAYHQSLEKIQASSDDAQTRKLSGVFGRAYHYLYLGLKAAAFNPVRHAFEEWLCSSWRGGLAKRNKRLALLMLDQATWIPGSLARDELGISHQRLLHLIREGVLDGETEVSQAGRKFLMVRRDQLELAREALDGAIDMKTAGALLGLTKARMRQILRLLFPHARKVGAAASTAWSISCAEVENLLTFSHELPKVSIPDEGCVSLGHMFRYWAWTAQEIVALIRAVCKAELTIVNQIDGTVGISSWVFKESELQVWKAKAIQGYGEWLSVIQVARLLNIKQQAAYDLVNKHFIYGDKQHQRPRGGVRVKRVAIEIFKQKYAFCTELAQRIGVSPRKVRLILAEFYIQPVSGPGIDGARQLVYLRSEELEMAIQGYISKEEVEYRLV